MAFTLDKMRKMANDKSYLFARGKIVSTGDGESLVIPLELMKGHQCARQDCRADPSAARTAYREVDSMGHWNCFFHPGEIDTTSKLYSCCNTSERGCVRGDHMTSIGAEPYPSCIVNNESDFVPARRMRRKHLEFFPIPPRPEALRDTDNSEEVLVLRYDPRPFETINRANR